MNYIDIIRAFGFDFEGDTPPQSIYEYAPVFHLTNSDGGWIVKRTHAPFARAQAIAAWTRSLAASGISVMSPATGFGVNPRAFQNEEGKAQPWVVYPFIDGQPYEGTITQIRAAGDLLGKIHAAGMDENFGLKQRETVVVVEQEEIEGDIERVLGFLQQAFPDQVEEARTHLQQQTQRYFEHAVPRTAEIAFPITNCSWDYKATNLIYHQTGPVLIDPDNGGRIPRAYDLAIAAILFHNEGAGPGRVFTSSEWQAFLEGYAQHVQLNELEKSHWEDILLCAWMDEGLWLLQDDETGWVHPKQSELLRSLLFADLGTFTLTSTS